MSAPSWSFRTYFLPVIALAVAAACSERQAPAGPDDAGLQPGFKGKPGGGDIVVSSVDPPEAEQGVTLDVTVLGRNFPKGDVDSCTDPGQGCTWAELGIDEVVDEKVKTNRSTWVSSRKLTANITIDAEAIPALYDAIVSLRGRRGIGAEKFEVKVHPIQTIFEVSFDDAPDNALRSDGEGLYRDGEDEVYADGANNLIFVANPKAKGGDTRTAALNFEGFSGPIHFDIRTFYPGQTAGLGFPSIVPVPGGWQAFGLRLEWRADGLQHRLRFNDTGCGGDGVVPDKLEGEEVVVTRLGPNRWKVDVLKGDPSGGDGFAAYCTAPAGKGPFPRGPFTLQGNYAVPFRLVVEEFPVPM